MMFSFRPVLTSLALLVFLAPLSSVVSQQEEDNSTLQTSLSDDNNDSSLMTNYNALREEGQGFYLQDISILYEKPNSALISYVFLQWWCNLEFSSDDATTNYGYVGRAVLPHTALYGTKTTV